MSDDVPCQEDETGNKCSSKACQPHTARAVLGRQSLFQMAFNERQGGVSRPVNGNVDLINISSSGCSALSSPIPPLFFCAYAQLPPEVSRTLFLFSRYEETKGTCHKRAERSCAWALCPDISTLKVTVQRRLTTLKGVERAGVIVPIYRVGGPLSTATLCDSDRFWK